MEFKLFRKFSDKYKIRRIFRNINCSKVILNQQNFQTKNFEERTRLLQEITQIGSSLESEDNAAAAFFGATTQGALNAAGDADHKNEQEKNEQLIKLWGRHGFLLSHALKGNRIFEFPTSTFNF